VGQFASYTFANGNRVRVTYQRWISCRIGIHILNVFGKIRIKKIAIKINNYHRHNCTHSSTTLNIVRLKWRRWTTSSSTERPSVGWVGIGIFRMSRCLQLINILVTYELILQQLQPADPNAPTQAQVMAILQSINASVSWTKYSDTLQFIHIYVDGQSLTWEIHIIV
jgi:hypothetical protein